jgi:hypothetical protein
MTSYESPSPNLASRSVALDLQYSQSSLQAYVDCRRRFQLRYLLNVAWPAQEAEPALEFERHVQQGEAFHFLIHQHLLGLPIERLSAMAKDEELKRWWLTYLRTIPPDLPERNLPELTLTASLENFRMVAKYDLISITKQSKFTIYDWKTSLNHPKRQWLVGRIQTRLYPYLLVKSGDFLNHNQPIQPEQVDMIYWFPNFPDKPERFSYNKEQYHQDVLYVKDLLFEINNLKENEFYLTNHVERCTYCTFRSLCERGIKAGPLHQVEESALESESEINLDFEQIAEIEF